MKHAILMTAGTSQRLRPLTEKIPKTLLSLGSKTIFESIMDNLRVNGITHVDLVTGHGHTAVEEAARVYQAAHPDMTLNCLFNDVYDSTGNIISMRKAMDVIDEDFILINADTIFHSAILKRLIESPHANAMVVDDVKELGEEEMKVLLHPEDESITHIHKSLVPGEAHGEYIGVLKLSKDVKEKIITALDQTIARDQSLYYEDGLQTAITDHGLTIHPVSTDGLPAMEIDTHEDLADAKELIQQIDV